MKNLYITFSFLTLLLCADGYVSFGNTKVPVNTPKNPELVPYKFGKLFYKALLMKKKIFIRFFFILVSEFKDLPQSVVRHLRWIAQKDLLGQDVFLIGPPGPLRRQLAMLYLVL